MGRYNYNDELFNSTNFQAYLQKIEGLKYNRIAFVKKMIDQYGNTPITDKEVIDLKIDLWIFGNQEKYKKGGIR